VGGRYLVSSLISRAFGRKTFWTRSETVRKKIYLAWLEKNLDEKTTGEDRNLRTKSIVIDEEGHRALKVLPKKRGSRGKFFTEHGGSRDMHQASNTS